MSDGQERDSRSPGPAANSDTSGDNVIERLLAVVFGGTNPERQRKRQLKSIARDLNKSRFKYYKPRGDIAQPGLARFFFDIYRVIGSAQKLLQNARESQALRDVVVEHFFTDEQRRFRAFFTEESIRKLAESEDPKQVTAKVKAAMQQFFASFDSECIQRTNTTYTRLYQLLDFVLFDYYFVLRKFDSSVAENDIDTQPKFEPINGAYVVDDVKDFLEVFLPLELDADWTDVFDVLLEYRGVEVIGRRPWAKLMSSLKAVHRSEVLTLLVRYGEKEPFYEPTINARKHRLLEPYLDKLKTQTEAHLQKIALERRNRKVERLCEEVFGKTSISRARFYTEKANVTLGPRVGGGYAYVDAFNYLKAFLIDYFKKDIRELQDLLVIRGKWSEPVLSQQLSDSFHQIMDVSAQLVAFDDSLADEGELGMKLRKAIGRSSERDKASQRVVAQVVEEINKSARTMINDAAQNLISMGRILKRVIEDHKSKKPELLLNWKEVEGYSEEPIDQRMNAVYRQLYFFIQLLQLSMKA